MVGISIAKGQRLRLESPGGGGFGIAFQRDPNSVARDVHLGYVSREAAASEYGVVIDEKGVVDGEATRRLRNSGNQ